MEAKASADRRPAVKVRKKNETVEIAAAPDQRHRWPLTGGMRLS
jgi:hypothetical protein